MEEKKDITVEDKIVRVLEKLRPYIQADGGDVLFDRFEDGVVYVKMVGACMHCPHASMTLNDGIESALVAEVPEVIKVINVVD